MTQVTVDTLRKEITRAHSWAEQGAFQISVKSFSLSRDILCHFIEDERLKNRIQREKTLLSEERDFFRSRVQEICPTTPHSRLLVIGDSLGLPRPHPQKEGVERTYSWMLSSAPHSYDVTHLCQRYYTTCDALHLADTQPEVLNTDTVFLHLGLNDCANRMFLEHERLALSLLPEELRKLMVSFSQKYRQEIIQRLPSRHYTDIDHFQRNLATFVHLAQRKGVNKIILATIIQPPSRFWKSTSGINQNFGRYNLEIMRAASLPGCRLLALDRLISENNVDACLLEDGMHLSDTGHKLVATEVGRLIRQP